MNKSQELIAQVNALKSPFSKDDLRLIRKSFGFSQKDFAKLLRVPRSWVEKREQGLTVNAAADNAYYEAILLMRNENIILKWLAGSMNKSD